MLGNADRNIEEIIRFFSVRGLEAGFLVPTKTGLEKSIMDAHAQISGYMRRVNLHDYTLQAKGKDAKVMVKAWLVKEDELVETKASLYRPETKSGDPRIWIYDLSKHVVPGNLLAILAHEGEIYVVNTSANELLESGNNSSSPLGHLLDLLVGAKDKPLEDKFSEWNLRLLRSFFSEASRDEEVFLRVDKHFLDQIGQDIGGDDGFLKAIHAGPTWDQSNNSFVQRVLALIYQRKLCTRNYKDPGDFDATYRGLHAPAYLPYLAALVRNDSENSSSYYKSLQVDLKLNHVFGHNEMEQVEAAWADLQQWTKINKGRFGFFKLRRLGGYRLIGVPRSQSILKPHDIEDLDRVFVQAQIRPGQELSEKYLTKILDEARATKSIFTAGFQKALEITDFEQPIRAIISSSYSDWDGTLPASHSRGASTASAGDSSISLGIDIGISLGVIGSNPLQLSSRWRLPAIQDSGVFEIAYKDLNWKGQFTGTEGANSIPSASQEKEFWKINELASNSALYFDAKYFGIGDSEPTKFKITLRQHLLWILIPAVDALTGEIELREGQLPGSGPAFLLAPPNSVESLRGYLEREKPEHYLITATGLPENWIFARLQECASLTEEQRLLPDGKDGAHHKPRSIRFVGGRSIRRGYSRMYLPYDMPAIELDAPEGTRIESPSDITIEEKFTTDKQVNLKPLRRFEIGLSNSRSASYVLQAIARDGKILGKTKLRVAGLGGEIVDNWRPFSMDNLGRPMASNEGLSGSLLPEFLEDVIQPVPTLIGFDIQPEEFGSPLTSNVLELGVREMFLDALAQSGSLDSGVARNLLQRLIQSTVELGEPILILLELRSRGHLEISTTHKGHISRIHSVKPTIYSLPSTSRGMPVWALSGTLRISHWDDIARETKAWSVHRLLTKSTVLEPWRLLIIDELEAKEACSRINFQYAQTPCIAIANWSAALQKFRDETFHNTMESIGSARDNAQRFNANKGLFTASPSGNTCELWKLRDLDTRMDNLYVLADQSKYSFVRDSRWGIWLALEAFAKWVSVEYKLVGIYPMPIMYESKNGTVWLPARIGLPCILERALILCSGSYPRVLTLQKHETEGSTNRISLSQKLGKPPVLYANIFYTDMSDGKWLAYPYVPEPVAKIFARKLGAVLDII